MSVRAADHTKIVEWSEQDGCFIGSAPPLIGPACVIVEEWRALLERERVSTK